MAERRPLAEGLKATPVGLESKQERQFVYGGQPQPAVQPPSTATTPISLRLRADLISALKRASLERQLQGAEPHTMRGILEEAIEPWLRSNGYLS